MRKPLLAGVFVGMVAVAGVALLPAHEAEAALSALASAGPVVEVAGTQVAIVDMRAPSSATPLASLTPGAGTALLLDVAPGTALTPLLSPQASWGLFLGSAGYQALSPQVTSVAFPATLTKKAPPDKGNIFITVSFKPTELKYLKASGDAVAPPIKRAVTGVERFTLQLGAASAPGSADIEAFAFVPGKAGTKLFISMDEGEAAAWLAWPAAEKRSGSLAYLGGAGATTLLLKGVTLVAKTKTTPPKSLPKVKCEMYVEELHLKSSEGAF